MPRFMPIEAATMSVNNTDDDEYYANESFETDDPETQEDIIGEQHFGEGVRVEEKRIRNKKISYSYSRHNATYTDALAYGSSSEDDNDVVISETVAEINVLSTPHGDKAIDSLLTPSARLFNQAAAARRKLHRIVSQNKSSGFETDSSYDDDTKSVAMEQSQVDECIEEDEGEETAVEDNIQVDDDEDDGDSTAVEDNDESDRDEEDTKAKKAVKDDEDGEEVYAFEYVYEEIEEEELIAGDAENDENDMGMNGKDDGSQGAEDDEYSDSAAGGDAGSQATNPSSNVKNGAVRKRFGQHKQESDLTAAGMDLKHVRTVSNIQSNKSDIFDKRPRHSSQNGSGDHEELVELYNNLETPMSRNRIPVRSPKPSESDNRLKNEFEKAKNSKTFGGGSGGSSAKSEVSIEYSIRSQTPSTYTASRHRMHIDFLKPSSTPSQRTSLPAGKRRNLSFTNDRTREIERHNEILLTKILSQKPTYDLNPLKAKPSKFSSLPPSTRVSSAEINRKKQQRQIDMDNQRLKRKLESIAARKLKKA